jgi:hypothetical protein
MLKNEFLRSKIYYHPLLAGSNSLSEFLRKVTDASHGEYEREFRFGIQQ